MAKKEMFSNAQMSVLTSMIAEACAKTVNDAIPTIVKAVADELKSTPNTSARGKKASNTQPKAEKTVEFVKNNGEKVMATPAQAAAWDKYRNSGKGKVSKKEALAEWSKSREGYKPSKALVEAIKKDRTSITRKVAKEKYGFIGTKDDLKALKESICK